MAYLSRVTTHSLYTVCTKPRKSRLATRHRDTSNGFHGSTQWQQYVLYCMSLIHLNKILKYITTVSVSQWDTQAREENHHHQKRYHNCNSTMVTWQTFQSQFFFSFFCIWLNTNTTNNCTHTFFFYKIHL